MIITILLDAALLIVAGFILGDNVKIKNFFTALLTALLIGLLNATLGDFLNFLTGPLNTITFGLIALLVNALVLKLSSSLIGGFYIKSYSWAIILAVCLGVLNYILEMAF